MSKVTTEVSEAGVLLAADVDLALPLGGAISDYCETSEQASAFHALDELYQDGYIESVPEGKWICPYDRLVHVDLAIANALHLPRPDPKVRAELHSTGIPTNRDFKLRLEMTHPEFGRLDPQRQRGPVYLLPGSNCVLLSAALWHLKGVVDDVPVDGSGSPERYEYMGRCVEAAQKVGAWLDPYLSETQVELIKNLALDVDEVGDAIHLGISSGTWEHSDLVLPNGKARPFPRSTKAGGKAVLSCEAREKIEQISERGHVQGSDVPKFLQNPEAYIPEGLDLSNFSERVRGFNTQVYNSRPYLHVNKEPRGWLEFDFGIGLENSVGGESGESLSIDQYKEIVAEAERTGERFVKHGDNWVEVDLEQASQFIKTVDRVKELRERDTKPTVKVLLDVIPNVDLLEFEVIVPDDLVPERPWVEDLPLVSPPDSFKAVLDQHQLLGFRWLCYLNEKQAGGLLADDMGVGKTAQVIALLTQLHEDHRLSPALVVLPKSLITNWMSELLSFAPTIDRIYVHADADRSRSADFLSSMNIVITTYDTARLDQVMLGGIDWTVVIADEAQFVKNPTAARTSVVKALKSKQALALTGTPVENGLIEFWCIMDYVQPGLLKSWSEFRSSYERPLVEADTGEERELLVETLLGELDPHFLRRMKEEVLRDLPPKHYQPPILVSLGDLQKRRYQEIVLAAKGAGRGAVLGAITRLLMTCAHPRASVDDWQHIAGEELIAECPKLQVTIEIVSGICRKNEKVLIFTGWKSVQRILQKAVWATFGVSAEIVNGDVTTRRQAIIDQFRAEEGFGVLILAPEVAGFGLNIIEANNVIHYTRPWNPAKENQATDRVHRRGQTKPVTVYYPTVDGTVENKLAELLSEKSQLTRDVLRPTSERTVSLDDLAEDLELKDN